MTILLVVSLQTLCCAANQTEPTLPLVSLKDDMTIPNCDTRELHYRILFIESRYCPHCKKVIKYLDPLITKYQLTKNYQLLDIIKSADRERLNKLRFEVPYTPVFIINCYAYVGEKPKTDYEKYLQNFLLTQITTPVIMQK